MEFVLIGDQEILAALSKESTQSPEDFLIYLEDALESGELTLDEVAQLMSEYGMNPTKFTQSA